MVTTRRQSGKLPPPLVTASANEVKDLEEGDDFGGYESPRTDTTDSDDDFAAKPSASKGRRPSKRAKIDGTSSKKTAKSKKNGSDLSCIVDMPLDILFEIFGHVAPRDLLNLSRTNMMLRKTLMSKQAITVWKAALKEWKAPDCPNDFSEPRWANLLFGGNVCQICGAKGIQRIDFGLRRRVCTSCLKEKLVVASKFRVRFPDYDPLVMDFLPYTNTGGWAHGYASNSKYYWLDDIYDMVKELGKYQEDEKMRKRGAEQALDNFTKARLEFVAANAVNARKYYNWASSSAEKLQEEKRDRKNKRYQAIQARLMELGHIKKDIQCLSTMSAVDKDAELTDRSWSRIRVAVEAEVNRVKTERVARERKPLIESRKKVIAQVYSEYKKTLVPTQWAYHPDDAQVYRFEGFAALIDDASQSKIEPQHCCEALQRLPSLVNAFNEEKKRILLALVGHREASSSGDGGGGLSDPGRNCLDLATSIFQCYAPGCQNRQRPLIAWQRAICHTCDVHSSHYAYGYPRYDTSKPVFKFSDRGSKAVESLAVLLELDARTAIPADYDRKAARFICLVCDPCTRSGVHGHEALTWRDCVAHFISDKVHTIPNWKLLTPEETLDIKRREGSRPDPADRDVAWSCNQCATHLDSFAKRQPVVEHLATLHGNTNPIEGVDFFYDQRRGRTPRHPVLFGTAISPSKPLKDMSRAPHRCLHCGGTRQFILQGIKEHLKAKHKVTDPVMGRDMQKI